MGGSLEHTTHANSGTEALNDTFRTSLHSPVRAHCARGLSLDAQRGFYLKNPIHTSRAVTFCVISHTDHQQPLRRRHSHECCMEAFPEHDPQVDWCRDSPSHVIGTLSCDTNWLDTDTRWRRVQQMQDLLTSGWTAWWCGGDAPAPREATDPWGTHTPGRTRGLRLPPILDQFSLSQDLKSRG